MIKQDFNILNNNELMSLIDGLQLPVVDGVYFASDEDDEDLDDDIDDDMEDLRVIEEDEEEEN